MLEGHNSSYNDLNYRDVYDETISNCAKMSYDGKWLALEPSSHKQTRYVSHISNQMQTEP